MYAATCPAFSQFVHYYYYSADSSIPGASRAYSPTLASLHLLLLRVHKYSFEYKCECKYNRDLKLKLRTEAQHYISNSHSHSKLERVDEREVSAVLMLLRCIARFGRLASPRLAFATSCRPALAAFLSSSSASRRVFPRFLRIASRLSSPRNT